MIRKEFIFIAMVLVCISHIKAIPIPPKTISEQNRGF